MITRCKHRLQVGKSMLCNVLLHRYTEKYVQFSIPDTQFTNLNNISLTGICVNLFGVLKLISEETYDLNKKVTYTIEDKHGNIVFLSFNLSKAYIVIFTNLKIVENMRKILLPVRLEPTSPSFHGQCPHHLDNGNLISFTAFSFILLEVTMFQHARLSLIHI